MRVGTKMFSSVNVKSVAFGSVIVFACIAFIFTGFGSLRIGTLGSMSPNIAAKVDSLSIEMQEFINMLNRQQQSQPAIQDQKFLAMEVLKHMVEKKILANESLKIGFNVSDNEIASAIKTISAFQDPQTNQFSLELFKTYLKSQHIQEIDFYNYVRNELDVTNMESLLALPAVVTDAMVNFQYEMDNTEFNLEYAIVNLPEHAYQKKLQEVAEKYANDLVNLKPLQDLYVQQKDKFDKNAQTQVRTILISFKTAERAQGQGLERTKEEARALAESIQLKIKQGAKFSTLASQYNDDSVAKNKKGDIGFVDESTIDPISFQEIKKLNPQNLYSSVIETPFGFRLFEYLDFHPAIKKEFEDVKVQLAKDLVLNEVKAQAEREFQNQLMAALVSKNITQINTLLVENNLTWKYLSQPFKITDTEISELGPTNQLAEHVFTLKKNGDILPNIVNFNNKKALIKLVSMNEPSKPTVEDLKELKKEMILEQGDIFRKNFEKFIHEKYEKDGKIKINPIVLQ